MPNLMRRFRREDGAVTVAAVLWIPFFVILMTMLADAAMIFYGQARALSVAQDANRSLSVGKFSSYGETEDWVELALNKISPHATATTTSEDYLIRTVINMPASDLAAVGFFSSLTSFRVQVVAQMVKEF
jgi:Flp pilus assembly protein TadG